MHTQWIERLEQTIKMTLQLLQEAVTENSSTWIDLPLTRLKDVCERVNSLKASASVLRGRAARRMPGTEGPPGTLRDDRLREFERYSQFNALRIAIIDLNEICEDLTQSYWVCAIGLQRRDGFPSIIDQVMSNSQLKKRLRDSCGALLNEGHSHLNKLRNALSHFPFTEYEARVIDEEPTAPIKTRFRLAQAAQNSNNRYYDEIFNPFCQLGERSGSAEHDFSRCNRNGLNACLFSAGRLVADRVEAFHQRLSELRAQ